MSLQTGGLPCGAISTRSRSASWASLSAWSVGTMPTVSPLGPTRRTSGTRIRSLIRSSVLMCPPGGNVAGRPCAPPPPRALRNRQRLPLSSSGSQSDATHTGYTTYEAGASRTGPDDLWSRAVDAGGRRSCEPPLVDPLRHGCGGTDRSTLDGNRRFPVGPNPDDLLPRARERPAVGDPLEVLALDDEAHRPSDVHDQRGGTVLHGGPGRERGRDRHRAALRVPGGEGLGAGEREQREPPVRSPEQHRRYVAALVVGQPRLVV